MTFKKEIAEILELFKIDAENDHADTNITTQDILEAFNKIVPDKKVVSRLERPRIVSKFEGFNQCVDQIERAINE
jgi:hypothetical protein